MNETHTLLRCGTDYLDMNTYRYPLALVLVAFVVIGSPLTLLAQDARELEQEKSASKRSKGPHPLLELMRTRKSSIKPELAGVHPRVYVTDKELDALRVKSKSTHRKLWQQTLSKIRALTTEPAAPPAQRRRAQNDVGLAIAEAAFIYKIEKDKKYLDAAKKFMDAAVSYDIWGYANNKPNVDLAAGHLLYGMGWGYDLLYNDLTENERTVYRDKLVKQARMLADFFEPKSSGKTYAYSQNHTFIPISGLAVAAYALYGEVPEAAEWATLSRAIFDRVLATYSQDGYYYEGFEYWIFSTPWLVHYLDAHAHATGEDLYDSPGFRDMHKYVGHSMLPDGKYVFDFGDIFEGPLTRVGKGEEYQRTHPGGRFNTNYNLLYRIAQRFQNGEAQGVANWLKGFNQINAEDYWSLVWFDEKLKPVPIQQQSTSYHFKDHDVLFWRTNWSANATAFAFKCGPSEGHHTAEMVKQFPEWRLSSGHAHPDANSFIIYAGGQYLTGDTGYAGIPLTEHHNTLLIDGKGQAKEGVGHDAFAGVPYDRLNQIRIIDVKLNKKGVVVRGDATSAYEPELGVKRFVREFEYRHGSGFTVTDEVETTRPAVIASLLHADGGMKKVSNSEFRISTGSISLRIEVQEPKEVQSAIETNVVTAPGPPGAVDKGERQERGQKLTLSTVKSVTAVKFVVNLMVDLTETFGGN